MALKKERQAFGFEQDPAVETHLGRVDDPVTRDAERRRKVRGMTPYQRRKLEADARRNKITVDLSTEFEQVLAKLCAPLVEGSYRNRFSKSKLLELLALIGLRELQQGRVTLDDYIQPTNTPRFEFDLHIDMDEFWNRDFSGEI